MLKNKLLFLSQKKKKPWKVISFIIRPLFNIDRSMKWKARVKWDKTSFHPRWKVPVPRHCITLIRPLLTHHWGLISKRIWMKPSVERFYYTLDHSCHHTNIKPCGVFVTSVGLSHKCHCISGANFCDKEIKIPQATGETPTARRKKNYAKCGEITLLSLNLPEEWHPEC